MDKKLLKLELCGLLFVITMSIFMQNLYELSNKTLIGVLFGSVNDSIWETCKTLLLPYLMWGMIELLTLRPKFKRFAVSKIASLYLLGLSYLTLCSIYGIFGFESHMLAEFIAAILCTALSYYMSICLYKSEVKLHPFFAPSLCLLLLFIALYCSFTPFPPSIYIFVDRASGLYGIIPSYIDSGAIVLDAIYIP